MLSPERLSLPGPEYLGEERRGGAGRLPEGSLPVLCCGPARPSRGVRPAAPGGPGRAGRAGSGSVSAWTGQHRALTHRGGGTLRWEGCRAPSGTGSIPAVPRGAVSAGLLPCPPWPCQ